MIQLTTVDNKVIYELEQSDLFPDYRSVLKEAIALQINLSKLLIDSKNIDNITWKEVNMDGAVFKNCSAKKNIIIKCTGNNLQFEKCNLRNLKVKKSNMNDIYMSECNLSQLSFRDSCSNNGFFIDCDCSHSSFYKSSIKLTFFHNNNISDTIFNECFLAGTKFIHNKPSKEWINDTFFIATSMNECDMSHVSDISLLYFWDSNIRDIDFGREERFVEVINNHSKIIYAINSDTVWWKPYSWNLFEKRLFRGTLKEFQEEVENEFPTTDIYPRADDFIIESELLKVCEYLKFLKADEDRYIL